MTRSCAQWLAAAVLVAALPAVTASEARAGQIEVMSSPGSPPSLDFNAAPGEVNDVVIERSGTVYRVSDVGAPLQAGAGCSQIDTAHAECPDIGIASTRTALGDGDDHLVNHVVPTPSSAIMFSDNDVAAEAGDDVVELGDGDDYVLPGPGRDIVRAGGGDDIVQGEFGDVGSDDFDGGPGRDTVSGSDSDDVLRGGPGDDSVFGGAGRDMVDSGEDSDTWVDGGDGDDVVRGGPGNDNVIGGPGDDRVEGGAGDDFLDPLPMGPPSQGIVGGADTLDGGPGDDTLSGDDDLGQSPRADVLIGGPDTDTVDYSSRRASLSITIGTGADDGEPGEGDDVRASVENVNGGLDSDSLVGDAAANRLDGRAGDDLVAGGAGDDVLEGGVNDGGSDSLDGGDGDDRLSAGAGDDAIDGGAGSDLVTGAGGADTVNGGSGNDDLSGGPGGDTINGDAGDDTLRGGGVGLIGADGADVLDGGEGADSLAAGPGDDRLIGGPGPDAFSGEAGRDTVDYGTSAGGVTVTFDDLPNDGEAGEGDNVARDVEAVAGGGEADTLDGDARPNALDAGSGQDYIDGGPGPDPLSGGGGRDVIRSRDGDRDVVSCGGAVDFAIADPADIVRDCEGVDRGHRTARLGRRLLVRPRGGEAAFRLPRTSRFVPLQERLAVPQDSVVDASAREVVVRATRPRGGGENVGRFRGGRFSLHQRRVRNGETTLRLRGGDFSVCKATTGRSFKSTRKRIRGTWGRVRRGHGRFRTRGRHSAAGVRGTVWLVEDRCDGTFTYVRRGTVAVRDFTLKRTFILHAGESHLARSRPASPRRR